MTIESYLKQLCEFIGLEEEVFSIDIEDSDKKIRIALTVPEEEASLFIGSQGDKIDAIELVLKMIFSEEYEEKIIVFDVNDYRIRREERIVEKATDMAYQVLDSGHPRRMSRLNSYERYLVHSAIAENPDFDELETFSQDEEYERVLVIDFKQEGSMENKESDEGILEGEDQEEIESEEDFQTEDQPDQDKENLENVE